MKKWKKHMRWKCIIIWPGFLFRLQSTAVLPVWWQSCDAKFVPLWWGGTNGYFPHQLMSSVCCGKQEGWDTCWELLLSPQHEPERCHTCWTWRNSFNQVIWFKPGLTEKTGVTCWSTSLDTFLCQYFSSVFKVYSNENNHSNQITEEAKEVV